MTNADFIKYKEVVDRLNEKLLWDTDAPQNQIFQLYYAEEITAIKYGGDLFLWDSENGDRDLDSKSKTYYNDLYRFIWKEFTKFVNDLNNIVAKTNFKQL